MAPSIMGNPDRPELGEELTNSFCRTDPEIAKAFARVTFTSDNRSDLSKVTVPTLSSEIVFSRPRATAQTQRSSRGSGSMSEFGPVDEYRDLFENAPCRYLTIGSDGRISKVNATLQPTN
jgi:hypothetical protein